MERRGWRYIPSSRRLCGKGQRRSTTSPTWYHCQSPHWKYDDWQIRLARKHERWQAQMAEQADSTFQEVFSQWNSTDLINLILWCVSSAVSLHYMSEALATTASQEEDVPVTVTVPELEGFQAPDPSDSPAHQTGTPPLPVHPFLDIPFVGAPPNGHPFAGFIAGPMQRKWDCSSSDTLGDQCDKQTHVDSQEVKVRSRHSSTQGNEDMPKLVLEAGPSSTPKGLEPTSPPSSPSTTDPDMVL